MPGAGKSTYVDGALSHGRHTLLSLDRIFADMRSDYPGMTDDHIATAHWKEASHKLRDKLNRAIARGDNIIYEATNLTTAARKERIDVARASQNFDYEIRAVFVHPPEGQQHIDRLVKRGIAEGRMGAIEKIDHYYDQLTMPDHNEGIDHIEEVGPRPTTHAFDEYRQPAHFRLTDIMPDGTVHTNTPRER